MKYKKINLLFVLVISSVLLISATPALAGDYGLVKRGIFDRYRVNAWWGDQYMDSNTDAFVWHGFGYDLHDPLMQDDLPVDIAFFINGDEVKLKRYTEARPNQWYVHSPGPDLWWSGEHKGGVQQLWFLFYQTFDAGYFEPGAYQLHIEYYISGNLLVLEFDSTLFVT